MTLFIIPQSSQLLRDLENQVLVAVADGSPHFLKKAAALSRNFKGLFYNRALHVISRLPASRFSMCGKLYWVSWEKASFPQNLFLARQVAMQR
jgi:hypothetical protein